ncbi:hypothetical protein C0991_005256 [Blastosporella zonata]|nr:hypothetical protein C0991_005256 [Blastosporella zonata]
MFLFLKMFLTLAIASSILQCMALTQTGDCIKTSVASFNLVARPKANPLTPEATAVKVIDVNTVPKMGYSILSVRLNFFPPGSNELKLHLNTGVYNLFK